MPSILDIIGRTAGVAGQFVQGYGEDQKLNVARVLAQAKADEEAKRNAVLNRVALAGIDPDTQGLIAGAKANAENPAKLALHRGEADIDVDKASRMAPIEVKKAVDTETQTAPIKVSTANQEHQFAADHPAQSFTPVTTTGADGRQHVSTLNTKTGELKDTGAQAKEATTGGASMVRGLGPGGVIGAGSGVASVEEMKAANPNLKKFEQGFLNMGPSELTALDRFRQKLAGDLQTHGFISAATAAEAERELAASNPALVQYGRNLKQWVVSDMNVSRGGTDERARMDQAVSGLSIPLSAMPVDQRADYLNQMWQAREARLKGLEKGAMAASAILERVYSGAGVPTGGATPHPPSSPMTGDDILKKYGLSPKQPPV